jgi:hypothetical protein
VGQAVVNFRHSSTLEYRSVKTFGLHAIGHSSLGDARPIWEKVFRQQRNPLVHVDPSIMAPRPSAQLPAVLLEYSSAYWGHFATLATAAALKERKKQAARQRAFLSFVAFSKSHSICPLSFSTLVRAFRSRFYALLLHSPFITRWSWTLLALCMDEHQQRI